MLAGMAFGAMAGELNFTYNTAGEDPLLYGYSKMETYDVAIRIADPALAGSKVKSMKVYMPAGTYAKDPTAWLSTELVLDNKVNVPDICSQGATYDETTGYLTVEFAEPYTMTADGVYVGYSFKIDELLGDNSQLDMCLKAPIAVVYGNNPDGLWVHTSRSKRKWTQEVNVIGAVSTMVVTLEGDFQAISAGVTLPEQISTQAGKTALVNVDIVNHGSEPINSIEYTYSAGSVSGSDTYEFDDPVPGNFGATSRIPVEIAALPEAGNYEFTMKLTKVNGVENPDKGAEVKAPLRAYSFLPVNRPLVEEYTGLWCGFCPRGFVALETMNEEIPDRFVALAYHNDDLMQILPNRGYPASIGGFPSATINRGVVIDPSEIPEAYPSYSEAFVPMGIDVKCEWADEERHELKATSTVTFASDMEDADKYRVQYYLVFDGLKGPENKTDDEGNTNPDYTKWGQSNYFRGGAYPIEGKYADLFINGGSKVYGLTFNDVIIAASAAGGEEGSIPATVKEGVPTEYSYTFSFTEEFFQPYGSSAFKNLSYLLTRNPKIRVVAAVVDKNNIPVNCNKSAYIQGEVSVEGIGMDSDAETVSVEYYDLNGLKLTTPSGICIKRSVLSDGSVKTSKAVF